MYVMDYRFTLGRFIWENSGPAEPSKELIVKRKDVFKWLKENKIRYRLEQIRVVGSGGRRQFGGFIYRWATFDQVIVLNECDSIMFKLVWNEEVPPYSGNHR